MAGAARAKASRPRRTPSRWRAAASASASTASTRSRRRASPTSPCARRASRRRRALPRSARATPMTAPRIPTANPLPTTFARSPAIMPTRRMSSPTPRAKPTSRRCSTGRAARIEAGAFGPALEAQLKPHDLTLRHFPQSFEYSTLGGWIATRSGGHFATLYTHIDDLVESMRVVTPSGTLETRRLPGSGAGPSPDRMFIGSEGILGVITEAWMRLQDKPRFRAGGAVRFKDFFTAAGALRIIAQAGLYPANCRILDPQEAYNTGAGDGSAAIMVLAFESGDHPVDAWMKRALECCADHGGTPESAGKSDAHREGAAGLWRNAFIRMPYARERMVPRAVIADTFETAITWERFEAFHDHVKSATEQAIRAATGRPGQVTCRFTHVYPDGPAPYFSFHALGRHGRLIEQWQAIKSAAADALIAAGGTITHHHAVGRDHRPWYDRQRPDLFAAALKAAKRALDPRGILNPGVLIDP